MKRIIFLSALISLLFAFSPINNAFAQDVPDAYLVKNVDVDIVSDSAVNARNKAFEAAQEKAFSILAERFKTVDKFSVDKLPNQRVISNLIQDFEITNEQASSKRYRATYDFRFRVNSVINYFGHAPTNYDPSTIKNENDPVLVLPFFIRGEMVTLWGKNLNPIFTGIDIGLNNNNNNQIILPNDDISDRNDIRDINPYYLTNTILKKLKARYKVQDIVLVVGEVQKSAPNTLKITLLRTDRGSIEPFHTNTYDENTKQTQGANNIFIQATNDAISHLSGDWKNSKTLTGNSLQTSPTNTTQNQFNDDIRKPSSVSAALQNATRDKYNPNSQNNKTTIRDVRPPVSEMLVGNKNEETIFTVNFVSIAQWLDMQKQLQQTPEILKMEMISMKTNMAEINVVYTNPETLSNSLQKRGFIVNKTENGYIIKRQGGAL